MITTGLSLLPKRLINQMYQQHEHAQYPFQNKVEIFTKSKVRSWDISYLFLDANCGCYEQQINILYIHMII
jgi:hypothetical protein